MSLPFAFGIGGLGVGIFFIIGGAATCVWSCYMLVATAEVVQAQNFTLVCRKAGGKPLAVFLEISILVLLFGMVAIYQIIGT